MAGGPQGIVKGFQHRLKLAVEDLVQALEPTAFAFEDLERHAKTSFRMAEHAGGIQALGRKQGSLSRRNVTACRAQPQGR